MTAIDQLTPRCLDWARLMCDLCVTTCNQPGVFCIGAAATVRSALSSFGVVCDVVAGGLCFRAGPSEQWDVVAFCDDANQADLEHGLFHAWVEARASDGSILKLTGQLEPKPQQPKQLELFA